MRISDVAAAAGCSVRSVRHLHEIGAVAEPSRTSGNYRDYSVKDLAAVVRARALIDAGVPVADVGTTDAEDLKNAVHRSLGLLDRRIAHLQQQRERLSMLAANPTGTPKELRDKIHGVIRDEQALQRELDAWDLIAFTGLATADTWEQLRRNLDDPHCVRAEREVHQLWSLLGELRPRNNAVRSITGKLRALLPKGLLREILPTLRHGSVSLSVGDVPTRGAQLVVLKALAEHFDA